MSKPQYDFFTKAEELIKLAKNEKKYDDAGISLFLLQFMQLDYKYNGSYNMQDVVKFATEIYNTCYHENLPALIKFAKEAICYPEFLNQFQKMFLQEIITLSEKKQKDQSFEKAKKEYDDAEEKIKHLRIDYERIRDEYYKAAENSEKALANKIKAKDNFEEANKSLQKYYAEYESKKKTYNDLSVKQNKIKELKNLENETKELMKKLKDLEEKKKVLLK